MNASVRRFDAIADNFVTSEVHASSPSLGLLLEAFANCHELAVCDIACGAGHAGLALADRVSVVIGVDPAPKMLQVFLTAARQRGVAARGVGAYAESVPLENASIDLAVCRLAAHHFVDVDAALDEMVRIVRPSGAVVIIDLQGFDDPADDEFNHTLEVLHDPTHVRSYTVERWRRYFADAGLCVQTCRTELSERPGGVTVERWCEIANTDERSRRRMLEVLDASDSERLARIGVCRLNGTYFMPVRTLFMTGRPG